MISLLLSLIWVCLSYFQTTDAISSSLACSVSRFCGPPITIEENTNQELTRTIAIGDIHGSYVGLLEDLYDANITTSIDICQWKPQPIHTILVQSGDLVDRGPGALESLLCLQSLQSTAKDFNGEVIRILGNHELWWLEDILHMKHKKADTRKKIRQFVEAVKEDVLHQRVVGAYLQTMNQIPIVFNHAGYNAEFLKYLKDQLGSKAAFTPETVVNATNQDLINVVKKCLTSTCKFSGEFYAAGKERGGSGIGGPYWTDFSVLEADAKSNPHQSHFVQVVGHSMADCYRYYEQPTSFKQCPEGLIRSTGDLSSIAVDGGMYLGGRGFLEIGSDGHFRAFEKLGKERRIVDFTQKYCPSYCSKQSEL